MAIRMLVPLYRCVDCGFVTTASMENAARAHAVGSPECRGEIVLIVDFARSPAPGRPAGRRRRTGSQVGPTPSDAPTQRPSGDG